MLEGRGSSGDSTRLGLGGSSRGDETSRSGGLSVTFAVDADSADLVNPDVSSIPRQQRGSAEDPMAWFESG